MYEFKFFTDPMTWEKSTIEHCIMQAEGAITRLNKELERRTGDKNQYKYGYPVFGDGSYRVADTFSEAVEKAVKELNDPDAGYRVVRVYV